MAGEIPGFSLLGEQQGYTTEEQQANRAKVTEIHKEVDSKKVNPVEATKAALDKIDSDQEIQATIKGLKIETQKLKAAVDKVRDNLYQQFVTKGYITEAASD